MKHIRAQTSFVAVTENGYVETTASSKTPIKLTYLEQRLTYIPW